MTLKELRKNKKMTQQELATSLGVKQSAVAMWENGQAKPSTNHLIGLATFFELNLNDLCAALNIKI